MLCAFDFACESAGNSSDARIAIIAITTRSSIKVNARFVFIRSMKAGTFGWRLIVAMPTELPKSFEFHLRRVTVGKGYIDRAWQLHRRIEILRHSRRARSVSRNAKKLDGAKAAPAELQIRTRQISCKRRPK